MLTSRVWKGKKVPKIAIKRNQSSIQVLKTLQVLLEDNYTMAQLVKKLNENEKESVFNSSVVSKYINTCRYCGIDIPKIHNKYYVVSMPFGFNITDNDFDLLQKMLETAHDCMSARANKEIIKTMGRLSKYSNKRIIRIQESTVNLTKDLFIKAIQQERTVRLLCKNGAVLECIPISTSLQKNRVCFNVHDKNSNYQIIPLDKLSGLEITNQKFKKSDTDKTVVFKIKGGLIERYKPREHEILIADNSPKFVVYSNHGETKDELLSRLLRYGDLCEIENPSSYREDMKQIINRTLANYGE